MIQPDIRSAGPYSIEVTLNDSLIEGNATFQMYISQVSCLYWNEIHEQWLDDGCAVSWCRQLAQSNTISRLYTCDVNAVSSWSSHGYSTVTQCAKRTIHTFCSLALSFSHINW